MESFPFPLSIGRRFPEANGGLIAIPTFFSRDINRQKYEEFLKNVNPSQRILQDPCGFSVAPVLIQNQPELICAVRVEGFYSPKKTKKVIGKDFNPVFPVETFLSLVDQHTNSSLVDVVKGPQIIAEPSLVSDDLFKEFVTTTMHEIRKLNVQIKSQAEESMFWIDKHQSGQKDYLNYRLQNIFATSTLISTRLDTYDFHLNPDAFKSEGQKAIPIYKKFEKAKHCLQLAAEKAGVDIKIVGTSFSSLRGYEIFEVLPFVILENAIKYSPPNQEIVATFTSQSGQVVIKVMSIGPQLLKDEAPKIFSERFRGSNARKVKPGTGIGLHFAKLVSDLHGIDISVDSTGEPVKRNGIAYCQFAVTLRIPTTAWA